MQDSPKIVVFSPWIEDFDGWGVRARTYEELIEHIQKNDTYHLKYYVPTYDTDRCIYTLAMFSEFFFREESNAIFAVDEIQRYREKETSPLPKSFYLLCDEGRHKGLDVIAVVRRPVQTTSGMRGLLESWITFRLGSKNDIDKLVEYFGDRAELAKYLPLYYRMEHYERKPGLFIYDDKNRRIYYSQELFDHWKWLKEQEDKENGENLK